MLCFFFFLNNRAGTPTLELDEGNVSTFAKFEYDRSSSKTEGVFEKTNMISCFFLRKEDDLLGWKSILCWSVISLEEGKWLILLPKDLKHNRYQRGGRNSMTMVIMMMMMMILMITTMTMMIIMCFLHPKGPQTGLAPGGAEKLWWWW